MSKLVKAMVESPVLWGALLSALWYAVILFGPANYPSVRSLFADHPVEYVSTVLFFVGIASLGMRLLGIGYEWRAVDKWEREFSFLSGSTRREELPEKVSTLLGEVRFLRLGRRLGELVRLAQGGADRATFENQLRHLAESDALAVQTKSALVRMFIWAIPILGFLGTVIGIAMALGRLAPQQLEESLPEVMAALTVAFNTTILALGLCLVLYFGLYFVERTEAKLLSRTDQVVEQVAAVLAPAESDLGACQVRGNFGLNAECLSAVLRAPLAAWELAVEQFVASLRNLGAELSTQLAQAVGKSLEQSLALHAERMSTLEAKLLAEHHERLQELCRYYQRRINGLQELERSVEERTETLLKALEGTEVLRTLQEALNRNLTILAGARQFEELVMSLTAAIHLLTARIENSLGTAATPDLLQLQGMRKAG